ncbi:MAG TPA: AI-2E family transporter [Vicinamibacterales bacterium]|nr:AI-2E family transporter [Vicinamibacterales bacterium]
MAESVQPAKDPLPPTPGQEGEPAPTVVDFPRARGFAISVLSAIGLIVALQWSQSVLIPLVIGILLAYALEPLVSALGRIKVPRSVGAAFALLLFVGILAGGAYALSGQALQIVRQVPEAAQRVRERFRSHERRPTALGEVQKAASELQRTAEVASQSDPSRDPTARDVQKVQVVEPAFNARSYLYWGGVNLMAAAGQFAVILFLVYFFLVTGDLYKRKIVKIAGPALRQKKLTVQILDEINVQISSFIRVQILTSFLVGVATAAVLWFFGVNQFIVWGLLAGIFNSIPYLGPIIVSGGLAVVSFMQFDDVGKAVTVAAAAFVITSLEGFLLTPALMSRAARMNPVAIFVGLLFWGWLWGVWGAVLAVPMLMMIKAVCDHIEELQPVGELLGE